MKILLVTERYWPEVGAAPSRLTNMAMGLVENGAIVDVLTCLPNYPKGEIFSNYKGKIFSKEIHSGSNIYRYWSYATNSKNPIKRAVNMLSFSICLWLFAFKASKCSKYDVVIIQTPSLFVAFSSMLLMKKVYRKKCILNVSDIWPSTAVDLGAMTEKSLSYKVMTWCERYLYRNADGILGQSEEILTHISQHICSHNKFLYRNLQPCTVVNARKKTNKPLKIVYAGLLGYAQNVLSIVQNVNFQNLGVEFHIIGGGGQFEDIKQYIDDNNVANVYLHGFMTQDEMHREYIKYDAALVPLAVHIYGAFPSKIFDILPHGLPILFCGGGEGASFVSSRNVGYVSVPGDYAALETNIQNLSSMSDEEFEAMSNKCISVAEEELDFGKQMSECYNWLYQHIIHH